MNVTQLQQYPEPQLNRSSRTSTEQDAPYLSFRQQNKRARLRLSSQPFPPESLPTKPQLFAIANIKGWFAASTHDGSSYSIILSPLVELSSAFSNGQAEEIPFTPQRLLALPAVPVALTFASVDSRLAVGLTNGQIVLYDTSTLLSSGSDPVQPIHAWSSPTPTRTQRIFANPGDLPDLIAVLGDSVVVVYDVKKLETVCAWNGGGSPETTASTISWSPKGKQLAIGMSSGTIVTFSPSDPSTPKIHLPPPPSFAGQSLISIIWLANPTFYAVFVQPSLDESHVVFNVDSKSALAEDTTISPPSFLTQGITPNPYIQVLKGWDPLKFTLVIGDSASSDIGVVANLGTGNDWHNFYLEESATPRMPLDKDGNETVLIALGLDLTNTKGVVATIEGEDKELPAGPLLYAYASDGTLQGWNVVNSKGGQYPNMATTAGTNIEMAITPAPPVPTSAFGQPSAFGQSSSFPSSTTTSAFGQAAVPAFGQSGFGAPSAFGRSSSFSSGTSAFGSSPAFSGQSSAFGSTTSTSAFGQPSAFGNAGGSAFGQSSFGQTQPPAFGQPSPLGSAFGQPSAFGQSSGFGQTSAFGQPSAFGQKVAPPAFGSTATPASSSAFSAFASAGPSKFGATGFGTPMSTTPLPSSAPLPSTSAADDMAMDAGPSGGGGFGGLSLGGSTSSGDDSKPAGFGVFGQISVRPTTPPPATQAQPPASPFGSTSPGVVKPATGFGAFSQLATSTALTQPPAADQNKAAAPTASAFGKSGFDTKSTGFGQSSFGQSTFGKSAFPTAAPGTVAAPTTGGFGAFAGGGGPASFGGAATTGGSNAFGSGASAFSSLKRSDEPTKSVFNIEPAKSAFGPATTSPFASPVKSDEEPAKPAFGNTSKSPFGAPLGSVSSAGPTKSAFGAGPPKSAFAPVSVFAQVGSSTDPSAFTKPTDRAGSPASSPEASPTRAPALLPKAEEAKNTALQSISRSSSTGAFGQLKTSSFALKPASGFGAFGSDSTPLSSPFFTTATTNPKVPPPVSAFAASVATKPAAPSPTFGSPSAIGKPVFGASSGFGTPTKSSTTTPEKMSKPISGGFGAFSGSSSAFSALTGPKKSFSELLKGETEKTTIKEEPTSPKIISAEAPKSENKDGKTTIKKEDTEPDLSTPKVQTRTRVESDDQGRDADATDVKSEEESSPTKSNRSIRDEPSFGSLSQTSQTSSFVEVSEEDATEHPTDDDAEGEEDDGNEDEDAQSFLSESFTEESDDNPDEEGVETSTPPSPIAVTDKPLPPPASPRSPSTTPKLDTKLETTTPKSKAPSPPTAIPPTIRATSSTPPGSPQKESPVISSPTPIPPSASSPFGIGLGRPPNTRPTRSSPLAMVAASEEEERGTSRPADVSASKPHPASPKPAFGSWSSQENNTSKDLGGQAARPKTPPILPSFGFGAKPAAVASTTPTFSPVERSGIFGGEPLKPSSPVSPISPREQHKPFTLPSTSSSSATGKPKDAATPKTTLSFPQLVSSPGNIFGGSVPGNLFGGSTPTWPNKSASTFSLGSSPQPFPSPSPLSSLPVVPSTPSTPPSLFGLKGTPPISPSTPFVVGSKTPTTPGPTTLLGTPSKTQQPSTLTPLASGLGGIPIPQPPQLKEPSPREGMQAECAFLYDSLTAELAELKVLAQAALLQRTELSKAKRGSRRPSDLADPTKWSLADLQQFGQTMKLLQTDIAELKKQKAVQLKRLRELQSHMLKAGTRKEEIARFNKAKTDEEFAKMLKVRTLGPEHLETQSQLRREIRTMRDRVQKLEDHLQTSKKKLNQMKLGKPGLTAPSLDTINRTYRNINIAISHQASEVSSLAARLSSLDISASSKHVRGSSIVRDPRLPSTMTRPINVTPHVAMTTAAALNAERSAAKLKKVLLTVRREPLLNTSAVLVKEAVPTVFQTPAKAPVGADQWNLTSFPSFDESPASELSLPSRRANKKHSTSVPLKRITPTASPGSPAIPSSGFSWGPVPIITPMKTISADVRKK